MATPAPTRRVKRGRGHSYYLDGEPVAGVTTILGQGVPKGDALIGWAANATAGYAVDHWADLAKLTPSKRLDALKRARYADRDEAANRGSEVHRIAQGLAAGDEVDVPDALAGYVDAYEAFVAAYRVHDLAVEATVLHRGGNGVRPYMGTVDLLAQLDGEPEAVLVDWKTGRSGIYPETALQLAAYANAQALLTPDGDELPMPPIARALAVWIRADGYDVHPLNIGPDVFRTFLYAQQLATFANADRSVYVHDALPPREARDDG